MSMTCRSPAKARTTGVDVMTPAARAPQRPSRCWTGILAGDTAEQVLTGWARGARYAGSGDRAAVRDLVYGAAPAAVFAALGGG
jgi:16S rRNA (cytosine967-C5)-methyltransferase